MKTNIILFILLTFSLTSKAQENHGEGKVHEDGTKIEVKYGTAGGSYYDVPSDMKNMDKYGTEWVPGKAIAGEIVVEAEKLGSIDFRGMQMSSSETRDKLAGQYLLNFSTARYEVAKTKAGDIFLRNRFTNLNHKNRTVFYQIDNRTIPAQGDLSNHVKINQNVLNAGPEIGLCKKFGSQEILPFTKLEGFADLAVKPLGMMINNYRVVESNSSLSLPDNETQRMQFSSGGMFRIVGTVTYKDKLYFRLKFDQEYAQGLGSEKVNLANCELELKVGYKVTPRIAVTAGIENNELVVNNNGRRAIDVMNIGSVGVNVNLSKRKK